MADLDPHYEAKNDIYLANLIENSDATYFMLRSVAQSLLAITDRLDRIDDALRNTVGGSPR